jgi:hypothetical protein
VGVEIAAGQTAVRLAPGLYCHRFYRTMDIALSVPIGLDGDAPNLGVFLMAIVELGPDEGGRKSTSRLEPASVRRR